MPIQPSTLSIMAVHVQNITTGCNNSSLVTSWNECDWAAVKEIVSDRCGFQLEVKRSKTGLVFECGKDEEMQVKKVCGDFFILDLSGNTDVEHLPIVGCASGSEASEMARCNFVSTWFS